MMTAKELFIREMELDQMIESLRELLDNQPDPKMIVEQVKVALAKDSVEMKDLDPFLGQLIVALACLGLRVVCNSQNRKVVLGH